MKSKKQTARISLILADHLSLYVSSHYPDAVVPNVDFLVSGFELSLMLLSRSWKYAEENLASGSVIRA
jgi:hypothetical protein